MAWSKNDLVITPLGRLARVERVNKNGEVLLAYLDGPPGDSVTLSGTIPLRGAPAKGQTLNDYFPGWVSH